VLIDQDLAFWENPPWGNGKEKYRLGLNPIQIDEWLNRKIGAGLKQYKKNLLDNSYKEVVASTSDSNAAQNILNETFKVTKQIYPDLIADMSLLVQDDLCLIRSDGQQELIAASVCSPSYWDVQSKIGKPLHDIHKPVTTLNEKIGNRISQFIRQAPIMRPFARQNWLIHGDVNRFHLAEETGLELTPHNWFIRSEKETLCRFHNDYSLFTINVMFQPLHLIFDHPEAKKNLLKSIKSFDDHEIEYFGGQQKIETLHNYLIS